MLTLSITIWPYCLHTHRPGTMEGCTEKPGSALGNTVYPEPASKDCAEGFPRVYDGGIHRDGELLDM